MMGVELETKGKQEGDIHYVHAGVPYTVEENFDGIFYDSDHDLAEVLQDQESLIQSFETNFGIDRTRASANSNIEPDHDQNVAEQKVLSKEGETSQSEKSESQLEADEALARALQELENEDVGTSYSETTRTEAGTEETIPTGSTALVMQAEQQDNVDPDNMTYEELQSLGEAIGTHDIGLSEELISFLPSSKYKTGGFFSSKNKHEECTICCMAYKNGDRLIALPCSHKYHAQCITRWLRVKKVCPICYVEVFGS